MTDEMRDLLDQKAEIERRIRILRAGFPVMCGKAMLSKEQYPTDKPDRWFVAVEVSYPENRVNPYTKKKSIWRTVANGEDANVVDAIPEIVKDLTALYEKVKADENRLEN